LEKTRDFKAQIADAASSRGGALATVLPRVLLLNALVWTLAAWLSRGNLDVAADMLENYAWGIEWQAGYSKHPPLFAWIAAAWFSVLPRTDLAYYFLSMLNAAVGLLGVAALARRFVDADRAAFAALVLAMSPLYSNLAIKFNANSMLLSVWPWVAVFFVAFMQDGRRRDAAACGALAALALLGKYFSVVLLLALTIAALALPAWRRRLLSMNTALGLLVGAAVLVPHVAWMIDHQFSPLRFAAVRSGGGRLDALERLLHYTFAQAAYLLPSLIFLLWSVPGTRRGQATRLIGASLARPGPQRELWWLALTPMFVVAAIAVVRGTAMASVWGMAQWFAVTPLWLAALGRAGIAPRFAWLRRALPVYWALVLAISGVVGYAEAREGSEGAASPLAELAQRAQGLWLQSTGKPLTWVAGPNAESMAIAFYAPGRTRWWSLGSPANSPWAPAAELRRSGSLLVCPADDAACRSEAEKLVATPPTRLSLHKNAWGMSLPPYTYLLYFLLPSAP
jgi:4-amino-4-deoxy-L-arabinose transferase-like glycosyltransferase